MNYRHQEAPQASLPWRLDSKGSAEGRGGDTRSGPIYMIAVPFVTERRITSSRFVLRNLNKFLKSHT